MKKRKLFTKRFLSGVLVAGLALGSVASVVGVLGQTNPLTAAAAEEKTVTLTFQDEQLNWYFDQVNGTYPHSNFTYQTLGDNELPYNPSNGYSHRGGYTMYKDYVSKRAAANATDPTQSTDASTEPAPDYITLSDLPGWLHLFDEFTYTATVNSSGGIVLPGIDLPTALAAAGKDFTSQAKLWQLDSETFWFGDPSDTDAIENGGLWAYTFTGWLVVTAGYVANPQPSQDIFQPGDVITPEALSPTAKQAFNNGNITLVAQWAKCYFVENQYENQIYKEETYNNGRNTHYVVDTERSTGLKSNVSDDNLGNDPSRPVATIDHLYSDVFTPAALDVGSYGTAQGHKAGDRYTLRAFDWCIMLTDELDYVKHNSQRSPNFGNDGAVTYNGSSTYQNGGTASSVSEVYLSATFKSFQGDPQTTGVVHTLRYRQYNLSCTMRGNFRFDNIKVVAAKGAVASAMGVASAGQSETNFADGLGSDEMKRYLEFTARFQQEKGNANMDGAAFAILRSYDLSTVVVNGGFYSSLQFSWNTNTSLNNRNWFIGRKAIFDYNITLGVNSTQTEYTAETGDFLANAACVKDTTLNLFITGGEIAGSVLGTSVTNWSYCTGKRSIYIHGAPGVGSGYEYNPKVSNVYGAGGASLFNDVYISVNSCNNIQSIYGGGYSYSGTIYGNATLSIKNSTVSSNIFGGGRFGNLERKTTNNTPVLLGETPSLTTTGGKATLSIQNTTVNGFVYGGGHGGTNTLDGLSYQQISIVKENPTAFQLQEGQYPAGWAEAPTGFPAYQDDTGEFLVSASKRIDNISGNILQFFDVYHYAALSLANVYDTEVIVSGGSILQRSLYGGGAFGIVKGSTKITVTDSTLNGYLFGGGDGSSAPGSFAMYTAEKITNYVAPTYSATGYNGNTITGFTITGQSPASKDPSFLLGTFRWSGDTALLVQDGTYGYDLATMTAYSPNMGSYGQVGGNTVIVVNGTTTIAQSVYGGGNKGVTGGNTSVTISGSANTHGIYGGGNQGQIGGNTSVTVSDSATIQYAYGGSNQAIINGSSSLTISGSATVTGTSFGGSNSADIKMGTYVDIQGGTIGSWIFGGNNYSGNILGDIHVTMSGGNISKMNGSTPVDTGIFGCGNQADFTGNCYIEVTGGYARKIYGGGWEATAGNIFMDLSGGSADYVHGGSYGPSATRTADIDGNVTVNLSGTQIGHSFYGGSETCSTISGNVTVNVTGGTTANTLTGFFAGGQGTAAGSVNKILGDITLNLFGGIITSDIFGGSQGSATTDVNCGNITINSAGGFATTRSIFGGGHSSDVLGSISMNIGTSATLDSATYTSTSSTPQAGMLYGGNWNSGNVTGQITVNVMSGTAATVTAGGGHADYAGTPILRISGDAHIVGDVYGGAEQADVLGTDVLISGAPQIGGSVFGGNNISGSFGNTKVLVQGGSFLSSIYGGGKEATDLSTNTAVTLQNTTFPISVSGSIYGGGYNGAVNASAVLLKNTAADQPVVINGSVYGGGWGSSAHVIQGTDVVVDLYESFTIDAKQVSVNDHSGLSSVAIKEQIGKNLIKGSIYGGGDVGQMGKGQILSGQNAANIETAANVRVTVKNGNILGSVFGGGNGEPTAQNPVYTTDMGTVFGCTQVNIWGGIIGGSVYGGGMQGHLYAPVDIEASNIFISELHEGEGASGQIFIVGSVFGGGDRSQGTTLNPSAPTVVGDTHIYITGKPTGANIFFQEGGVYGDGNLCMVKGERTINLTDFTAKDSGNGLLKTFHSLQRADRVVLNNTDIVLLGAKDLVDDSDATLYAINRVDDLAMTNGSTIKLTSIVKYLGALSSDRESDRVFINKGNNGTNGFESMGGTNPGAGVLTETEIANYRSSSDAQKNLICVANGLYLEVIRQSDDQYGPITGLFTLALLNSNPGEGGGFVYGDITTSTGDFICQTRGGDVYTPATGITAGATIPEGQYYVRTSAVGYALASGIFAADQTYYTRAPGAEGAYLAVVDDVGGFENGTPSYYYWYINGDAISFTTAVTATIGIEDTAFPADFFVPKHTQQLHYVLTNISGNQTFLDAVSTSGPYTLVSTGTGLSGNQIALELKMGTTSLGFVSYSDGNWYLDGKQGYQGKLDKISTNTLIQTDHPDGPGAMQWVLHKSNDVTTPINGMELTVELDLFESQDGIRYTAGTGILALTADMSITRLNPTQVFYRTGSKFLGDAISPDEDVNITRGSAFTVEYHTYYIPKSFPAVSGSSMTWKLSTVENGYYRGASNDKFATAGQSGIINSSTDIHVLGTPKEGLYYLDENNSRHELILENTDRRSSYLPSGTKITMVDDTGEVRRYYYYICTGGETTEIDLTQFCAMGTNTTIAASGELPDFMLAYDAQGSIRVDENLFFIFDFAQSTWDGDTPFEGAVVLEHLYASGEEDDVPSDMVDYVNTVESGTSLTYHRIYPKPVIYNVATDTGLDGFTAALDGSELTVEVTEDATWANTVYGEQEYALHISCGAGQIPNGFHVVYNGRSYYPRNGNDAIIVPISSKGSHILRLGSSLGDLAQTLGNSGTLNLELWSAPAPTFHNEDATGLRTSVDYAFESATTTALQVLPSASVNRIFAPGDAFRFTYTAIGSSEPVTVHVNRKNADGSYTLISWEQLFDVAMQPSLAAGTNRSGEFIVTGSIGTYRLEFVFADRTEILNIIVK